MCSPLYSTVTLALLLPIRFSATHTYSPPCEGVMLTITSVLLANSRWWRPVATRSPRNSQTTEGEGSPVTLHRRETWSPRKASTRPAAGTADGRTRGGKHSITQWQEIPRFHLGGGGGFENVLPPPPPLEISNPDPPKWHTAVHYSIPCSVLPPPPPPPPPCDPGDTY